MCTGTSTEFRVRHSPLYNKLLVTPLDSHFVRPFLWCLRVRSLLVAITFFVLSWNEEKRGKNQDRGFKGNVLIYRITTATPLENTEKDKKLSFYLEQIYRPSQTQEKRSYFSWSEWPTNDTLGWSRSGVTRDIWSTLSRPQPPQSDLGK